MKKFKEGQKVICVNNESAEMLEIGKIYTISNCFDSNYEEFVSLEEIGVSEWYKYRFKNANSELIKERLGVK